ncbi:MAG: hypothetical protein H0X46_09600 [Bacteroidetes bacterium]|nr:hypothetical protein [Bacteroidota bacterium]
MEEERTSSEKSNNKRTLIFFAVLLIFMISWGIYYFFESYKEKSKESEANKAAVIAMQLKFQKESVYSDSLYRINMRFNKYRHAAESQAFRDSISRRMEYKPGDYAFTKTDSARVIITDIIIGGGLYDYYFRYRIMDRSGAEKEIKPELLFNTPN